ncbi:MAG: hypothetical protein ACOX19_05525 [Fermentimonas sp.]|jgi:hypothetical protein
MTSDFRNNSATKTCYALRYKGTNLESAWKRVALWDSWLQLYTLPILLDVYRKAASLTGEIASIRNSP